MDNYRIDRLTAEFIFPETEQEFRRYIRDGWVADTRQTIMLAAIFYLMFAVTDFMVMGASEDYFVVLANRVFVCAVGLTAAYMAKRWWRHLVNGVVPTVVVAIALAAFIANVLLVPLDYGVQGMGMMAMLLGVYTFIPNRFIACVTVSAPASVAFLLVMMAHLGLPIGHLATLMATLVVTNILGAMVSWRNSIMMRETFCDHAVLKSANERLEGEAEARRRLEDVLRRRAETDETTGVANRTAFYESGSRLIAGMEEAQRPLAMLLIDVDYFKQLNGTYGHMRGDEVLKALVSVCQSLLTQTHYIARLGGEEFVVLLPDTVLAEAARLAERIRSECQRMPVAIAEVTINFTVCVGAVQRRPGEAINVMLRRADEAVSAAKYKGRNRVEVAS